MNEKGSKNQKGEGKRFGEWMGVKETLHNVGRQTGISEGQVWWAIVLYGREIKLPQLVKLG